MPHTGISYFTSFETSLSPSFHVPCSMSNDNLRKHVCCILYVCIKKFQTSRNFMHVWDMRWDERTWNEMCLIWFCIHTTVDTRYIKHKTNKTWLMYLIWVNEFSQAHNTDSTFNFFPCFLALLTTTTSTTTSYSSSSSSIVKDTIYNLNKLWLRKFCGSLDYQSKLVFVPLVLFQSYFVPPSPSLSLCLSPQLYSSSRHIHIHIHPSSSSVLLLSLLSLLHELWI